MCWVWTLKIALHCQIVLLYKDLLFLLCITFWNSPPHNTVLKPNRLLFPFKSPSCWLLFRLDVWKICYCLKQNIYRLNWLLHQRWLYRAPLFWKWTMLWRGGNWCRQNTEQLDMDMWIQQTAALPLMKYWHISRLTMKHHRLQGLFTVFCVFSLSSCSNIHSIWTD